MGWQAGRGHGKEVRERIAAEEKRGGNPNNFRFWLKEGTERNVIFLDDDPLYFYEHNINKDGSWRNYATCTGVDADGSYTGEGCPLCEVGDKPYFAGVWSVIDLNEYKDAKGRVWKNQRRLFVAKQAVIARLTRRSDALREGGRVHGLAGMKVRVFRSSAKANATGDDFDVIGPAKKAEVLDKEGKMPAMFNYDEVFAPNLKTISQLARFLARGAGGGSGGYAAPESDRDDVFAKESTKTATKATPGAAKGKAPAASEDSLDDLFGGGAEVAGGDDDLFS